MATPLRAIELMARADWTRLSAKGVPEIIAKARSDLLQAIEICRSEGEPAGLIVALQRLGRLERDLGSGLLQRARVCYQEAADLCRRLGDKLELAHCRRALGELDCEAGALDAAEANFRQALALYHEEEDVPPLHVAETLRALALAKEASEDVAAAFRFWRQAREVFGLAEASDGVAEADWRMARLLETV